LAGNGFPQLSAIFEVTATGLPVIADGGIQQPGDVAKAIAAGQHVLIIGSLFAGTDETPGDYTGSGMKIVRGQASSEYMDDQGLSPMNSEQQKESALKFQLMARRTGYKTAYGRSSKRNDICRCKRYFGFSRKSTIYYRN